jgi:hypothetical protein
MDRDPGAGESPQVRTGRVTAVVCGILVVLALIAFGFQGFFAERIGRTATVSHGFPAPAVIPDERAERQALEAGQRRDLEGAGGRLPVDAAMKAIAAKGDHAFDPLGAAP